MENSNTASLRCLSIEGEGGAPKPMREIAWKAQLRLCARYSKLARTGKPANVVTGAIARELAGFVWAIARHVPPTVG
jgi:transposase